MVRLKKFLIFSLILISMVSLVSGFSFVDILDGVISLTGKASFNKNPSVQLGAPSDTQVVGNPIMFSWTYFDPEDDPQVSYTLLVDDNQRFTSPIAYYGLKEDSRKEYLPLEDGQYYWRVEVNNKFGTGYSEVRIFYFDSKEKLCVDGTRYFDCSNNKPDYCRGGVLVKDCIRCGCETGAVCSQGGVCVKLKCSDGTVYGDCSINKPKYCLNTNILKDTCSLCGCPGSLECGSDGSCKGNIIDEGVKKEENVIENPPETGFIGFLKRISRIFKYLFTGSPL